MNDAKTNKDPDLYELLRMMTKKMQSKRKEIFRVRDDYITNSKILYVHNEMLEISSQGKFLSKLMKTIERDTGKIINKYT